MTLPYSQIPPKALKVPSPFESSISEDQISEFKQLLKLSKIPEPTYESLQEDGRFGVSHKWLTNAKNKWAEFDWYDFTLLLRSVLWGGCARKCGVVFILWV